MRRDLGTPVLATTVVAMVSSAMLSLRFAVHNSLRVLRIELMRNTRGITTAVV